MYADGTVVNGSFTGTATGNLIAQLSSISAYANGVALFGSGSLYAPKYNVDTGTWLAGEGVVSFDGLENNFAFMDVDYPANLDFTNYFYDVNTAGGSVVYVKDFNATDLLDTATKGAQWSVTLVPDVNVPEPASLLLLGVGIAGLLTARRKQAA